MLSWCSVCSTFFCPNRLGLSGEWQIADLERASTPEQIAQSVDGAWGSRKRKCSVSGPPDFTPVLQF